VGGQQLELGAPPSHNTSVAKGRGQAFNLQIIPAPQSKIKKVRQLTGARFTACKPLSSHKHHNAKEDGG
jgi:hypothetical protein